MSRISENDLILPSLFLIDNNPGITTSELINALRDMLNPSGEDLEILDGRRDDKFSQVVRNLVSHHTLDNRYGFTNLIDTTHNNSSHSITPKGASYLQINFSSLLDTLSSSTPVSFSETTDRINKTGKYRPIICFEEDLKIIEGEKKESLRECYKRSAFLRDLAINILIKNHSLDCAVCGFNFYEKYGPIGSNYIEIHHRKPIYQYSDEDQQKNIKEALQNTIPLCSNCHSMVHRDRNNPLSIEQLKSMLINK